MESMIQIVGISIEDFWEKMRAVINDELKGNPAMLQQASDNAEYSTTEAMAKLNMKQHATFKRYLKRNNIICNRKQGKVKYYLHAHLFKSQTFK